MRRKRSKRQSSTEVDRTSCNLKVHPKYIAQRFRLFSKFEQGISLSDSESWYSVLPEKIASHVASRCSCDVIVDPFAGAGGSCIQFATTCTYVIAIENVSSRLMDAKHNAEIYQVSNNIDFILGDAFQIFPSFIGKVDVIFIAPPWGGPNYENGDFFNFGRFQYRLSEIVDSFLQVTENLAISLPRSSSPRQIASAIPEGRLFEVEYNYLNDKCKTITVYLGSLVKSLVSSMIPQQSHSSEDREMDNGQRYQP
ncbi:methyltransferase [Galdieria sulphuraria]|uniref:Trimethylguanosine synthase n=1 Tax=Galdieria sulphuraria TaxID=130081 RepID=M2WYT0_GALSU|nr:methyltransferase [Galdieria sulphuraria]EME29215.1 methyltransferase [Galdieria sulphuraria]|eukprot:XP_005705735.1 methyltransferase [Galdieria sulphuraria]